MTTALLVLPLLMAGGAAMDFSRLANVRSQYQEAADAAALAAATKPNLSKKERRKIAHDTFLANLNSTKRRERGKLVIMQDGVRYEANTKVELLIMSTIGVASSNVEVIAEVAKGAENVEIALVLDTTGSMEPNMRAMKRSARRFVETLDQASGNTAKFSVVPFVAAVNAGRHLSNNELDRNADSEHHANILENKGTFFDAGVTCGVPGDPDGGSTEEGASLGKYLREFFGVNSAHAQTAGAHIGQFPTGWTSYDPCLYSTPPKLNHFTFFSDINVRWKGCVEARPGDLDVSNDPAATDANTKWVPYFWPDEESRGTPATTHNFYFGSDYEAVKPVPDVWHYNWGPTRNVHKYQRSNTFNIDERAPDTLGPNKACPDEVLPLNADTSIVKQTISGLSHWNHGGTVASEGVAWGMRTLTPGAPFTQGSRAGEGVHKVLVLFGDGKNEMPVNIDNSPMMTDYSAYGYAGGSHLSKTGIMSDVYATPSGNDRITKLQSTTQAFLDERMLKACENAKAEDITVLTILFNETDEKTRLAYRQCASSTDSAILASDADNLDAAFNEIASKIMKMYLRK